MPELLVVAVILPIIMTAIAAAIIGIARTSTSTRNSFGDSENAQLSSAYFTRDVQGAQYFTINSGATAPAPCGNGTTFVLGLYRTAGSPFYVGYWLKTLGGTLQLVREACSSGGAVLSTVVASDDVTASSVNLAISPDSFATGAGLGWTPTQAVTYATALTTLPSASIPVVSTNGFSVPGTINVLTATGYQALTCTAMTASSFTSCTGGQSGSVVEPYPSFPVTQAISVSNIELSVTQAKSTSLYRLAAVPHTWCSTCGGLTAGINPLNPPALITLGGDVHIQGSAGVSLTVDGVIDVNSGDVSCNGNPAVTAYGFEATNGTTAIQCGTGGPTITPPSGLTDPISGYLPTYGTSAFPYETRVNSIPGSGNCVPGEYTVTLTCSTLEPGVYVLDQGVTLTGSSTVSMAADANGNGVLLYLPCNPPGAPTTCNESITLGGSTTFSLAPLTADQASTLLGDSALAELVVWQDTNDPQQEKYGGTPSSTVDCSTTPQSTACGTLYAPSANVTFQGNTVAQFGRIVAKSVSFQGSAPVVVTGQ